MGYICVFGSLNMDMVMNVKRIPCVGETILVSNYKKVPGGKGANQALASGRLGCDVYMVGKVGRDEDGTMLIDNLKKDGVNVDYVFRDERMPTGVAIISVDENGGNTISVVSGANMNIGSQDVSKCRKLIEGSKIVISQFETPLDSTIEVFKIAKDNNAITILNPAPAQTVPDELMSLTDIIVPNEKEIYEITNIEVTDIKTAKNAASKFIEKGARYVIVTLGEKGAAVISNENAVLLPAHKVNAIDTTAAGDSFIGALASKLSISDELGEANVIEAAVFANKVSSIVVQRSGAQTSLPYLHEI